MIRGCVKIKIALNFKTVNINNTLIKQFILLSSSKFDSIKLRTTKAHLYVYYMYYCIYYIKIKAILKQSHL